MLKILIINPGSTSTKLGIFHDDKPIFIKNVHHDVEELAKFKTVGDQKDFRTQEIINFLSDNGIKVSDLDAIGARGGILPRHTTGTFLVTDEICEFEKNSPLQHPVNLAAPIAKELADSVGIKAYITDGESSYEMEEIAKLSGLPELPRDNYCHILNQKAIARFHSKEKGVDYNDQNLIVLHMGGGISCGAHKKGRVVDSTDAVSEGSFSPERTGSLPSRRLVDLAYSGKYDYKEMKKLLQGKGGFVAYLGTNDAREVMKRVNSGDEQAKLVVEAMILQISKDIAAMSVHYEDGVDGILLTGGLSNNSYITSRITDRVKFIAPVFVYKGEREMESLAEGVVRVLNEGEELIKVNFK